MRSVSIPTHQYSLAALSYLRSPDNPDAQAEVVANRAACRAYTRVVLRLRAQAEADEAARERYARDHPELLPPVSAPAALYPPPLLPIPADRSFSGSSSRPPSPSRHGAPALPRQRAYSSGPGPRPGVAVVQGQHGSGAVVGSQGSFRSPLFRMRRAPLLRVYVPSPEGDWLSDTSVLECEEELRRAGALGLLRVGDVVWDAAVGDEGNIGRLIWDGNFLIVRSFKIPRSSDMADKDA